MLRTFLLITCLAAIMACNNNKGKSGETGNDSAGNNNATETPRDNTPPTYGGGPKFSYTVDGKEKTVGTFMFVQKDKDKLSPGNEYIARATVDAGNQEILTLSFVFTLKPGTYPVVATAYLRGTTEQTKEIYGGLAGGKPKLTKYAVNLTEVKDLGDNGMGGHKWALTGNVDGVITIPATKIMLLDKTRQPPHPESIAISGIKFSNITIDDNYDEMNKKGMEKFKKTIKK